MWVVQHRTAPRQPAVGEAIHLLGFVGYWARVEVNGARGLAVKVPDDHPLATAIAAQVSRTPHRSVADDSVVAPTSGPPVAPTGPDAEDRASLCNQLAAHAHRNGWVLGDITGSGKNGEPGEEGGRGMGNGLTLAESAIIRAPEDWRTLQPKGEPPWMSPYWSAYAGWQPPAWGKRYTVAPPVATTTAAVSVEAPAATAPPVPAPQAQAPAPAPATPTLDYPLGHAPAAAAIVQDLYRKGNGKPPTPNAVTFWLDKAGLCKVTTKAQVSALNEYHIQ